MSLVHLKEELVFLAKSAETAERYEEMKDFMKELTEKTDSMSNDERNLLNVAYKSLINPKISSLRILKSLNQMQYFQQNPPLIEIYKRKIEGEINDLCGEILSIVDKKIDVPIQNNEAKIFYLKMKSEYFKYLSEALAGEEQKEALEKSNLFRNLGNDLVNKILKPANPQRLGLALSHAVFNYEINGDVEKAREIAKKAFEEALGEIDQIEEKDYTEVIMLMQLLKNNLDIWTFDGGKNKQ